MEAACVGLPPFLQSCGGSYGVWLAVVEDWTPLRGEKIDQQYMGQWAATLNEREKNSGLIDLFPTYDIKSSQNYDTQLRTILQPILILFRKMLEYAGNTRGANNRFTPFPIKYVVHTLWIQPLNSLLTFDFRPGSCWVNA